MEIVNGVTLRQFTRDLRAEIREDRVTNGAAALAYYLVLSIFPAAIFLLSTLPYLPIPNLYQAIMDLLHQALPTEAADLFEGVVQDVTQKRGGLLSFGLILTIWAASNGLFAVMQQLNVTYDVKEGRPFWKVRGTAVMLTVMFVLLVLGGFGLVIFGGVLQQWIADNLGWSRPLLGAFAAFRWVVILGMLLLGFALTYYFGPDVEQEFRFISPGSVFAVITLGVVSFAFRYYVANFGNYTATYGTLGAVVILLFWLYLAGLVTLVGSEINALIEHYHPEGKEKGEKEQPEVGRGRRGWLPHPSR
ncbi:MAG: YihY/virulence factor BrkB family protein [Myxococcota bacterium]